MNPIQLAEEVLKEINMFPKPIRKYNGIENKAQGLLTAWKGEVEKWLDYQHRYTDLGSEEYDMTKINIRELTTAIKLLEDGLK